MSLSKIESALIQKLIDDHSDLEYDFPNLGYEPTIGTPWARVSFLPAEPLQAEMGTTGRNRQSGLFRISLFYPRNDQGRQALRQKSELLVQSFKRGTVLGYDGVTVRCDKAFWRLSIPEESWIQTPVEVQWFSYTSN